MEPGFINLIANEFHKLYSEIAPTDEGAYYAITESLIELMKLFILALLISRAGKVIHKSE